MKKITKRIFSAILSAIMLILALPLTGFASDKIYTYKYEYIELGSYPQSQVKDSALISKLGSVNKNWVSYFSAVCGHTALRGSFSSSYAAELNPPSRLRRTASHKAEAICSSIDTPTYEAFSFYGFPN